jgi:hypothetical protein
MGTTFISASESSVEDVAEEGDAGPRRIVARHISESAIMIRGSSAITPVLNTGQKRAFCSPPGVESPPRLRAVIFRC